MVHVLLVDGINELDWIEEKLLNDLVMEHGRCWCLWPQKCHTYTHTVIHTCMQMRTHRQKLSMV